jgi:hypothetical protein
MKLSAWLLTVVALCLSPLPYGCQRGADPGLSAVAPPTTPAVAGPGAPEAPNANAAHYGPHGVAATPTPAATAPSPGPNTHGEAEAPVVETPAAAEMAGHPCHCGASCKCGHCAGAVPGCHCKTERNNAK